MKEVFLSLDKVSVQIGGEYLLSRISLDIMKGEQWALVGASGSGKTLFAHTLKGRHYHEGQIRVSFGSRDDPGRFIHVVEQHPEYRDSKNMQSFYYQQRFNASDAGATVTLAEDLENFLAALPDQNKNQAAGYIRALALEKLLQEPLIQLSSGEYKRLQILKGLVDSAPLLILDQPLTGLDAESRTVVKDLLGRLGAAGRQALLIASPEEIPDWITHIAVLDRGRLTFAGPRSGFSYADHGAADRKESESSRHSSENETASAPGTEEWVRMVDVTIRYGDRIALDHISWKMQKGEKWSLSGPNGAGKSTFLSLITADHPQAYANEIYLFGRRRGSGESIWEIKEKIGFLSSELHVHFDKTMTAYQAIGSGFFDTIGLFRRLNSGQEERVRHWLEILSLRSCENISLSRLSAGQQRLILLARALVKDPLLLILDEPAQGLDPGLDAVVRELVDQYCRRPGSSLIYVSHYARQVPAAVNHFLRLEAGRIV